MVRFGLSMKTFVKRLLLVIGALLLIAFAAFCYYAYFVFPKFRPMMDHDLAMNYARVLSQAKLEDLSALGIPPPATTRTSLSQSDTRRILQRLHDEGLFPEWRPDFNLLGLEGKPLEFSFRLKEAAAGKSVAYPGGRREGDFVFSVKASTLPEAVENW